MSRERQFFILFKFTFLMAENVEYFQSNLCLYLQINVVLTHYQNKVNLKKLESITGNHI